MMALLTTANSGVDFVLHWPASSAHLAFHEVRPDDEMCGMVRRLREGPAVSPETLAYDVIARVGPGGNYLMDDTTVERCRSEFWKPSLCDRGGLEAWVAGGRQDAVSRAHTRCQKLLLNHKDPELDQVIRRQLHAYLQEHLSQPERAQPCPPGEKVLNEV
jgi:trimethylamine--corrinoid protein Co-methyltransferase